MKPIDTTTIINLAFNPSLETGDERFTESQLGKLGQLRHIIKNKLQENPEAKQAVISLERDVKAELETVNTYLEIALEGDRDFANEIARLASDFLSGGTDHNIIDLSHKNFYSKELETETVIAIQPSNPSSSFQNSPLTSTRTETIWERGNKLIAFMAGGAFIGGMIAQAPGAIIGAILSAIYASFVQIETGEHDSN